MGSVFLGKTDFRIDVVHQCLNDALEFRPVSYRVVSVNAIVDSFNNFEEARKFVEICKKEEGEGFPKELHIVSQYMQKGPAGNWEPYYHYLKEGNEVIAGCEHFESAVEEAKLYLQKSLNRFKKKGKKG